MSNTSHPERASSGGDIGYGSQSDEAICDIVNDPPNSEPLRPPVLPQPVVKTLIHDISQICMGIGSQSHEPGDINGRIRQDAEAGSNLFSSGKAGDAGSTQAASHSIPATCEQPRQSSPADAIHPQEPKWQRFSHMEIRNIQPLKAASVPTEPDGENAGTEMGNIHCSSHNYGP